MYNIQALAFMKCCYFVKSISFHFPRIFIYNHTVFALHCPMKQVHLLQSEQCPAFRSIRVVVLIKSPRENMSHLIKFFCSPALREIRGRIRMCTVHKHTKLKGSRLSHLDPVFFFFFFLLLTPAPPLPSRLIQSCVYAQCYPNSVKNILYTIGVCIKKSSRS